MTIGLIALIFFQQIAFSLRGTKNNNLFDLSNPGVFGIFNIIELIWGIRFLKDSCIYVFIQLFLSYQARLSIGTGEEEWLLIVTLDFLIVWNLIGDLLL